MKISFVMRTLRTICKKREKHLSRSVTFRVFFTFFKLYKWYQIAQLITFDPDFRQQERFVNKSLMGKMLNVV